jgi:membrane protein YqaA with SNARE-associated domain
MSELAAYGGLFMAAFLAATIIPAQSEAVLLGLVATNSYPVLALLLVASTGNVLGAVVNWGLGRGVEQYKTRKWFPVKEAALNRAQGWYTRYGRWSLLLSWVPLIGDPITVAAGVMREKFWVFFAIVTVAKIGRYLFLVQTYLEIAQLEKLFYP